MAKRKFFGTDGVRGKANVAPMTAQTALKLGISAGSIFKRGDHKRCVVIGKDTRLSGYMIEPSLVAGFTSVGMDVFLLGPIPTPAVAMLTKSMRADLGVMISASHNPFEDNGIKLFGPDGFKLSDEIEMQIEERMEEDLDNYLAPASKLGRAQRIDDALGRYTEYVKRTFPEGLSLDGLKIVLDCANGAAYKVAPTVLWELGAEVITIGVDPDGFNINRGCGAVDTEFMRQEVVKHGADLGIALDGDADRVMVSDENGKLIDGDQLLALIASRWVRTNRLRGKGVVATVMSNMGLEKHLEDQGLKLIRTQVGDRYVVDCMRKDGFNLGGEQSGHIILSDYATTGDGLASALQILAAIIKTGDVASKATDMFEPYPQLLKNVKFDNMLKADEALESKEIKSLISSWEEKLGDTGRILIRKSGTEPLVRVMSEARCGKTVKKLVNEICKSLEKLA